MVQTGAKSWFGGVKNGFFNWVYYPGIASRVMVPEIPPMSKQIVTAINEAIIRLVWWRIVGVVPLKVANLFCLISSLDVVYLDL